MSTLTETPPVPGWKLRKAQDGDDWGDVPARESGKVYWVREHTDGRTTKVSASPGTVLTESTRMDLDLSEGDEPEEAAPRAEVVEAAPAGGDGVAAEIAAVVPGEDNVTDTEQADTAEADEPVEVPVGEGEEQPDGFPNPGAGFSRGLSTGDTLFPSPSEPVPLAQQIHPSKITTHPSTLMRAGGLDSDHVADLEAELRSGRTLPAVDVFYDGFTHWLGDGNHRHAAALRADRVLDVNVHKGSLRDAILFAVRSNAHHGLKRTNDDKRLAVVTLLSDKEWGLQSDTSVAGLADVTQPFVGKVQQWLVKLLPALPGDGVEDPSDVADEEFSERTGVPAGVVSSVRSLTDTQLETLTHNVMARAESRTDVSGKRFSVERPAVEEPALFTGEEAEQEPPVEAQEPAEEGAEGSGDDSPSPVSAEPTQAAEGRPEVEVTDRKMFAGEAPDARAETPDAAMPALPPPPQPSAGATPPAVQPAAATLPAPAVPADELTLVIKVKAGKTPARGLTLSGRVGDGPPVWLSQFTLVDLEPAPPALRALLARLGGGVTTEAEPAAEAPRPTPKKAPKKAAPTKKSARDAAGKSASKKAAAKPSKKLPAKAGAKKKAGKR
jgi:hypothetical protein